MVLTKTTKPSIIKTRSQSRTGTTTRTGTHVAPAPAPDAVATGGRTTGTTNDPVAVVPTTDPSTTNPVAVAIHHFYYGLKAVQRTTVRP